MILFDYLAVAIMFFFAGLGTEVAKIFIGMVIKRIRKQ